MQVLKKLPRAESVFRGGLLQGGRRLVEDADQVESKTANDLDVPAAHAAGTENGGSHRIPPMCHAAPGGNRLFVHRLLNLGREQLVE